jgi:hypothetical protein
VIAVRREIGNAFSSGRFGQQVKRQLRMDVENEPGASKFNELSLFKGRIYCVNAEASETRVQRSAESTDYAA